VTKHSENPSKSGEIRVLLHIGEQFIEENQIRSAARFGKGTKIFLINGDEIVANVSYDRVADLLSTLPRT
jgi:hypothetical protein